MREGPARKGAKKEPCLDLARLRIGEIYSESLYRILFFVNPDYPRKSRSDQDQNFSEDAITLSKTTNDSLDSGKLKIVGAACRLLPMPPVARTSARMCNSDDQNISRIQATVNENEWESLHPTLPEPTNHKRMCLRVGDNSLGCGSNRLPEPLGRLRAPC
jgi:hypothetical protein